MRDRRAQGGAPPGEQGGEPADAGADGAAARPPAVRHPSPRRCAAAPPPKAGAAVNDLLPFLDFVEHHPVGSSVNGVVESYSSHGAYVSIGDVRGYVPLRLMGDPPPRSARATMKIGDAVTLVVTSFAPARRSVDLAVPHVAPIVEVQPTPELEELAEAVAPSPPASKRAAKKAAAEPAAPAKRTEEGGRCRAVEPEAGGSRRRRRPSGRPARRRPRRRRRRDEEGGGGEEGARQAGDEEGGRAGAIAGRRRGARPAKRAPRKRTAKAVPA